MSETDADAVIDELAAQQFGAVHRRQLLARQVTLRQIRWRVDHGRLIPLGNGVFAVRGHPPSHLRQYKAAELAVEGAALGMLPGAHLLRLHDRVAPPEIVVAPGANHRCSFARVHRRTDALTTRVQGIRVTTVPQTLVDLTGRVAVRTFEPCWTRALVHDRTTLDALEERVAAAEAQRLAHRGVARTTLASLVDGAGLTESELEVDLLGVARLVPGIPELVPQLPLPWWRSGRGRGDVGVPDWRLILEADGRSWHTRVADFERDRDRDNEAVANGWSVLRFTALRIRNDPEAVIDVITRAGRRRGAA